MNDKFLSSVCKTATPWVLGIIFVAFSISVALHPHDYLEVFKYFFKLPVIILKKLIKDEFIDETSTIFIGAFLINLGLRLWNPIKFPFKWSKIFGLFFFNWGLISFLYLLIHLIHLK